MDDWNILVEGMWDYQWTKIQVPYLAEFAQTLYEESQGIVDIAVKLFMLTQGELIASGGKELITPEKIREVAKKKLRMVRPMLDDLKSGEIDRISRWPDIAPLDWDRFYNESIKRLKEKQKIQNGDKLKDAIEEKRRLVRNQIAFELLKLDVKSELAKTAAEEVVRSTGEDADIRKAVTEAYKIALQLEIAQNNAAVPKSKGTKSTKVKIDFIEPDLRYYLQHAKNKERSTYSVLKEKGFIKSPLKDFDLR